MRTTNGLSTMAACAVLLAGCGSGSDTAGGGGTGTLTLGVTDAPVDGARKAAVSFTGVTLKPAEGPSVEHTFDTPKEVNLLNLTGSKRARLLEGVSVEAGKYNWIRLHVQADRGTKDSYLLLDSGETRSLYIPSGEQTGLKLVRGFTVPEGGEADFTVDFDLRKSVHQPREGTDYYLRPALRLVDNGSAGHLRGHVSGGYLSGTCESGTGNGPAVYVYPGADSTPVDVDGAEPDPLASARVEPDSAGGYAYEVGYLAPGSYTVAFTCNALGDDPEADDDIGLTDAANVDLSPGAATTYDFKL